jgi:hypothetical protein
MLIFQRQWTRQPQSAARSQIIRGQGLVDLLIPAARELQSFGGVEVATPDGVAFVGDGDSKYWYRNSAPASINLATGCSILAIVRGASTGVDRRSFAYGNSADNAPIWAIGSGAGTASSLRVYVRDLGVNEIDAGDSTSVVFEEGRTHAAALVLSGATLTSYVDGQPDVSTTGISLTGTFDRTAINALVRLDSSPTAWNQTPVLMAAAWNRPLTDAEARDITKNYWQLFAPLPRRLWAPGPFVPPPPAPRIVFPIQSARF